MHTVQIAGGFLTRTEYKPLAWTRHLGPGKGQRTPMSINPQQAVKTWARVEFIRCGW